VTDDAWRAEDDLSVEVGANAEADATIDRMEMALENFMAIIIYCSPKEECAIDLWPQNQVIMSHSFHSLKDIPPWNNSIYPSPLSSIVLSAAPASVIVNAKLRCVNYFKSIQF